MGVHSVETERPPIHPVSFFQEMPRNKGKEKEKDNSLGGQRRT